VFFCDSFFFTSRWCSVRSYLRDLCLFQEPGEHQVAFATQPIWSNGPGHANQRHLSDYNGSQIKLHPSSRTIRPAIPVLELGYGVVQPGIKYDKLTVCKACSAHCSDAAVGFTIREQGSDVLPSSRTTTVIALLLE
jgi:hypothetical protein